MNRPLAILLVSFSACFGAEPQPREEQISLRARVEKVAPLASFSGVAMPVDADPKFALTLRVESVSGTTNIAASSVVIFAIHSPSKLFAGEPVKGKIYDFSLHRKTEHGRVSFSDLRVRKAEANKGAALDTGPALRFYAGRYWCAGPHHDRYANP